MGGPACASGDSQYVVTFTDGSYQTFCLSPGQAQTWVPGYNVVPGRSIETIALVPNDADYSSGGLNDPNNPNASLQQQWLSTPGAGQQQATASGETNPFSGTPLASAVYGGEPLYVWIFVALAAVLIIAVAWRAT